MERVLVIDDDVELCRLVRRFLTGEGFEMNCVSTATDGVTAALGEDWALVVLDVMMPDINGFEALRRIRQRSRVPVLMLTARGDTHDRVLGLEMGADDYLPKPFDPAELSARIRAVLRRTSSVKSAQASITVGDLELDGGARVLKRCGIGLDLTTVEFDLLAALIRVAGSTVSRQDLVRIVLGREFSPFDRSIDTHVCNLRKKLGPFEDGNDRIKGVRGAGYLYAARSR